MHFQLPEDAWSMPLTTRPYFDKQVQVTVHTSPDKIPFLHDKGLHHTYKRVQAFQEWNNR